MSAATATRAAAVVIGRNEGPRLSRCLRSVLAQCAPVVYVDSASTDGSPAAARALGADVVALDLSIPFTFGRARNVGAARAVELAPDLDWIQFVDADSEVVASWFDRAVQALVAAPRLGAVHGRVRERRPGDSVYDQLYALEFDPRTEDPAIFGGMAMVRATAFRDMGGYVETMQTFEDHELSFRLRRAGWQVVRLETEMVIHEAGMTRAREWWRRERRQGHSRAQLVAMHGRAGLPDWRRGVASICCWAALLPVAIAAAAWQWGWVGLLLGLIYPALVYRVFRRLCRRGIRPPDAALYAVGRVAGKFPQLQGVLSFLRQRRRAA